MALNPIEQTNYMQEEYDKLFNVRCKTEHFG